MVHFSWTQLIPAVGHDYIHVATLIAASALLVVLGISARVALGNGETAVVPAGKFSIRGIFEMLTGFIVNLSDMVLGEDGRKYVPFFATIFTFIFVNNLMGLVPGLTPATDNLNTTLALGIFVFVIYNALGLIENGIAYLKHFMGPLLALAPLMLIIEIVSHVVRPASLGLRLQGNMTGDHTVLGLFLDLMPYGLPIPFYCLGIFVCFMQAFVFTILSMVYVSMAIAHDH